MSASISRTNLVILRRRMAAVAKRREVKQTVFIAFGATAVLIGIFGVAGLVTGHAGAMETLRLLLMSLTAVFLTVSVAGGVATAIFGRALTIAEEALNRAGERPSLDRGDEMGF